MKKIVINIIKFYQKNISANTLPRCKFYPTCSNYGIEAIERFGVLKGGALTVFRFFRCNPFSKGGYDPVPKK